MRINPRNTQKQRKPQKQNDAKWFRSKHPASRYNIFRPFAKPNQAKRRSRLFVELNLFTEQTRILRVLLQKLSNSRRVLSLFWDEHRLTAIPNPDRRQIKDDEGTAKSSGTRSVSSPNYLGSFDAITSIFSIEGGLARSSPAFSINACATLPFRCASRPESSATVSKIP